jgi:hypothetical protein
MLHSRRENGFRPVSAGNTDRANCADLSFLGDNVMARSKRSGDDRTIALLAWKSRQMKIMRGSLCRAYKRSIPGHWRHHPAINNRIAQLGNFGHWGSPFLVRRFSSIEPALAGRRAAR